MLAGAAILAVAVIARQRRDPQGKNVGKRPGRPV
jgi:hypothetical protein